MQEPNAAAISVIEEEINVAFPHLGVKMLLAQPFLELAHPIQEPFLLTPDCAQRLMQGVDRVLALAATFHPQVIVFPEFCIPGVSGVERLRDALLSADWQRPSVIIGGVSGLTRDQYQQLSQLANVAMHIADGNRAEAVTAAEWVNVAVTFVLDGDGNLHLWLQPKLSPSRPELTTPYQSMFRGKAVHVFRARFDNGVANRFLSVTCFDWIGREDGDSIPDLILSQLNDMYRPTGTAQNLHWAFVLQYNSKPNDHNFLASTRKFLTQGERYQFVERRDAAVVMACTASSVRPSKKGPYGYSSLVFNPVAPLDQKDPCPPTFCTNSAKFRASDVLGTCKDAAFRERGECIHEIVVRVPAYVVPDSTDRSRLLEHAAVFSFDGGAGEPRLPGEPVPAVVKWANDELDEVPKLAESLFIGHDLQGSVRNAQEFVVTGYRNVKAQFLANRIHASAAERSLKSKVPDPASDVDDWDVCERGGLHHVVQSLTLVRSVAEIDATEAQLHGRHEQHGVEIAAISGQTHEDCIKAFPLWARQTHSPILLVSKDALNVVPLPREVESFADPRKGAGVKFIDLQTLLSKARNSTQEQYNTFITELFNVTERRII